MVTMWAVLTGVGAVFLVLGLVTGHDIDFGLGDSGSTGLSLPALGAFLAAGGATGLALTNTGVPAAGAVAVAAGVGVVAAVPVAALTRRLRRLEDSTRAVTAEDFVGALGELVHPTSVAADGLADFTVAGERHRKRIRATAAGPIPVGARVLVVDTAPDGTLLVDPTPDWLDPDTR